MARIRTIKPEFPQSESVGRLSREARLLFVLLFTIADDAGRARAASRMLASLLYPYDDDARDLIGAWLDELEAQRCIRRYEVDGTTYLVIIKWQEHQKIDRPSPSRLPAPPDDCSRALAKPREPSSTDLGPRTVDLGRDQDSRAVAKATRPGATKAEVLIWFEAFRREYPRRAGADPKEPAFKRFLSAVTVGKSFDEATADRIIAGAKRYADEQRGLGKVGTEHVAQAQTWLNQKRWQDYPEPAPLVLTAEVTGSYYAECESEQLRAWDDYTREATGKSLPRDKRGGWRVAAEWPPGHLLANLDLKPPAPKHEEAA